LALGKARVALFDIAGAASEFDRALVLAPGSARVQAAFAEYAPVFGEVDSSVRAAQRAVILDPRNIAAHINLVNILTNARRFDEANVALKNASAIGPMSKWLAGTMANLLLASGEVDSALKHCESPDIPLDQWQRSACLAFAYHAAGRQREADRELEKFQSLERDSSAVEYAATYAQWGNLAEAAKWLNTAERLRDPGLLWLKVSWEFDPIRNDPKFQAIVDRLKIP
jgi:tetratricopeptide (TPR) repeat protein